MRQGRVVLHRSFEVTLQDAELACSSRDGGEMDKEEVGMVVW